MLVLRFSLFLLALGREGDKGVKMVGEVWFEPSWSPESSFQFLTTRNNKQNIALIRTERYVKGNSGKMKLKHQVMARLTVNLSIFYFLGSKN